MDPFEPAGDLVDGGGLIDDAGVCTTVNEVGGCEEVGPELATVCQGVLVELAEGLFLNTEDGF